MKVAVAKKKEKLKRLLRRLEGKKKASVKRIFISKALFQLDSSFGKMDSLH